MDIHGIKGDIYQTGIIARYEVIKNLRSKKLYLFLGLIIVFLALMTFAPYIGDGLPEDPKTLMLQYSQWVWILVSIGVPLFAASALSSEFEERTALLMFTRPVRKTSIFMGKFLAAFLISTVGIVFYYVVAFIVSFAVTGSVVTEAYASLGLSVLFILGATGFSLMLSAFFKRSTSAIIVAILSFILILQMIYGVLMIAGIDPWFELTYAASSIVQVIAQEPNSSIEGFNILYPEIGISAVVMVVWCAVTSLIALLLFKRREF